MRKKIWCVPALRRVLPVAVRGVLPIRHCSFANLTHFSALLSLTAGRFGKKGTSVINSSKSKVTLGPLIS